MRLLIGQLVKSLLVRIQNVFQPRKRDMHQRYLLFTFWIDILALFAPFSARRFCCSSSFRNFSSSMFRRSASICPRVRCSAGAPDGNEVPVRTGTVTNCTGCKFNKILLIVFCSDVPIESRCSILEGSFTSRTIRTFFSTAPVRLAHVDTPYSWNFACGVSFPEETQSHLSPFGIFQTL